MKELTAFNPYFKNYKKYITLNIIFNVLHVIFSIFSLTVVMPFLDIIFHPDKGVTSAPAFSLDIDTLKDFLKPAFTEVKT